MGQEMFSTITQLFGLFLFVTAIKKQNIWKRDPEGQFLSIYVIIFSCLFFLVYGHSLKAITFTAIFKTESDDEGTNENRVGRRMFFYGRLGWDFF